MWLALVVVCASLFNAVSAELVEISVTFNSKTNSYEVKNVADNYNADAYGYYVRNYNNSGWNTLDAFMQEEVDSVEEHLQYFKSLGYLEGYVSCSDIKGFYNNFYSAVFGTDAPGADTIKFLQDNFEWVGTMAAKYADTDDYWYTMKTTRLQLVGLFEGYVAGCGSSNSVATGNIYANLDHPTLEHFLMINAWGDLYQIATAYQEPAMNSRLMGKRSSNGKLTGTELKLVERCSAIVKILPGFADIVYGHATWDSFESLSPRILKHYNFPLVRNGFAEHHYDVYFSSSPAVLSSVDDFFTVSGYAQLGIQETTNNLYNPSLLKLITPESSLSWQRAIASNQLAKSGADWAQVFARYHSGTYTNQWMSLDLKLFTPGSPPQKGFFTVFEEVPGLVHIEDQTEALIRDTYWASYNIPFYPDISEASGYAALCAKNSKYCHDTDPRANLFRQYHSNVTSVEGGKWILSYNNWQNDAYSNKDSCDAISCRGDLERNPLSRGAFGALDAKVTSAINSKRNPGDRPILNARLGPTHDQQPIFCWSKFADEADYSHVLQPDCFPFGWTEFPPSYQTVTK